MICQTKRRVLPFVAQTDFEFAYPTKHVLVTLLLLIDEGAALLHDA